MPRQNHHTISLKTRLCERRTARLAILLSCMAVLLCQSAVTGDETQSPVKQSQARWTTSRILGSPEPPPPYTVERVFPHLTFSGPVHLLLGPARERYFLTEYTGRIVSFSVDPEEKETAPFLELKLNLHSLAFHPRFEENRFVYVFGNTAPDRKEGEVARNLVLRFEVSDESPPRALLESQQVILEYDSNGHNGGEAKFGPDGFLYISGGDGSSDSDDWNTGQDVSDLPSCMLRIDVDHPEAGRNYRIPDDNPLVNIEAARGELWAYGFRNPWRFSFDEQTGNLYVGDVGQDLWEMIFLVRPGDNFGWSVKEGGHDFHPYKKQGPTPIVPPLVVHHHTESRSITGGHVYHGPRLPELEGAYLYGDYETGKIWGLRHQGNQVTWHQELADISLESRDLRHRRQWRIFADRLLKRRALRAGTRTAAHSPTTLPTPTERNGTLRIDRRTNSRGGCDALRTQLRPMERRGGGRPLPRFARGKPADLRRFGSLGSFPNGRYSSRRSPFLPP